MPQRRASLALLSAVQDRAETFAIGFRRHGFAVLGYPAPDPRPGDVLLLWNRRPSQEHMARAYERAGAAVLVAENAYVQPDRVKHFALAVSHHNGAGSWPYKDATGTDPARWNRLGVRTEAWRAKHDGHVLVLAQRGIGEAGVAMPQGWTGKTEAWLRRNSKRDIRIRRHPAQLRAAGPALAQDLDGAWCCVTWGSAAGIQALLAGVPVLHDLGPWIGAPAARHGTRWIEAPWFGDRSAMLHRLAWAQWSEPEVEQGEAMACLLGL